MKRVPRFAFRLAPRVPRFAFRRLVIAVFAAPRLPCQVLPRPAFRRLVIAVFAAPRLPRQGLPRRRVPSYSAPAAFAAFAATARRICTHIRMKLWINLYKKDQICKIIFQKPPCQREIVQKLFRGERKSNGFFDARRDKNLLLDCIFFCDMLK